ncbi:MAG TPA: TolC family protein [Synergistales bacterium]|nr:TolC family protein [Synergistales bacterium]
MTRQRRYLAIIFVMLSLLVIALGRRAWADTGLLLDEALVVSLAMENNPQITIAEKRVEQARARARGASSGKAPVLSVSALYQETYSDPQYPLVTNDPFLEGYALGGFRKTWRTALSLSWLIYSSGAVENSIRAAELSVDAVRAESQRTAQLVAHASRNAFFELQRTRARASVAEEAYELAQEHRRRVEALYRNGIVAKNELLRVEVAVSEAELNLIRAESGIEVAFSALERSVGTTIRGRYRLPEPRSEPGSIEMPLDPVTAALANRPEFRALESSVRSARSMAAAAVGEKGPSVYFQGDALSVGQTFYPDAMDDWKISIVAEWKLYDGGKSKARKDEALALADELLQRVEDMKHQVDLEVSVASLDLRSALQRLEVARSQVTLAEEDHRMAVARYSAQVGTSIDVLDARVALSGSRTQLVDAVYDALKAWSDMKLALGEEQKTLGDKR